MALTVPVAPQYRLAPIPRARHYFACASLIFVCILLVQVLILRRSVGLGGMRGPTGVGPGPPENLRALSDQRELLVL